jgi:uncharacterized protein (TIRG00374 family)
MSKRWSILIKASVTLALLGLLAWEMDLRQFLQVLASASLVLILSATLLQLISILIAVVRWQAILESFRIGTPLGPLARIMFMGQFFNLFLPSSIGGDVFRAFYLARRERRGMPTTLTTTILERSAGLCALLGIGVLFAALHPIRIQGFPLLVLYVLLIGLYALANVVLFHSWTHRRLTGVLQRWRLENVEAKLGLVYEGLESLRRDKRAILVSLGTSFVIQFFAVVIMWVAARAIHIEAPFYVFLIFIPIVNLTIMIPVTINGFGLRESAYFLLFSQVGLPVETSVTLSLLNFVVVTLASLPGGVIYSLHKKDERFDELLAERSVK